MKKESCFNSQIHEKTVERIKEEVLSNSDAEKIAKIFQTLSDSGRLKIVLALLKGDMCVYHLTEVCNATQSNVSHHLRVLRDNKIVKAKRMGQNMEYSIADEHIREIVEKGIAHLGCSLGE